MVSKQYEVISLSRWPVQLHGSCSYTVGAYILAKLHSDKMVCREMEPTAALSQVLKS
jgi:hypothetical protein